MDVKDLVQKGDLAGALAAATQGVKKSPANISARTALFELLCLEGDLDRAEKQLTVLANDSLELAYAASMLKANVGAERKRRAMLAGEAEAETRPDAPAWAPAMRDLVRRQAAGEDGAAAAAALEAARVPVRGTFNGEPFSDLRDGDDLLANCLELLFGGNAWWCDWRFAVRMTAGPPRTLRDTVWFPLTVSVASGSSFEAYCPATYAGTAQCGDDALKLGHRTDWIERHGLVRGVGRRTLFVDGEPRDLLELRDLVLET